MSEAERHVTIQERCFEAVHFVRREIIVGERLLLGAICLVQACAVISCDRDFTDPVHIEGHSLISPSVLLNVGNVHFHVTQDSITVDYDTSKASQCEIIGGNLTGPGGDPVYGVETWYEDAVEHLNPHSHTKAGLPVRASQYTHYIVQIRCTTLAGESVIMPSLHNYYCVATVDSSGNGGGYEGILYWPGGD